MNKCESGHPKPEKKFIIVSREIERSEIKIRAKRLIAAMHDRGIQTGIFLDKSARPLAWLIRKAWNNNYSDRSLDVRFVNIGTPAANEHHKSIQKTRDNLRNNYQRAIEDRLRTACTDNVWISSKEDMITRLVDEGILNLDTERVDKLRSIYGSSFDGKRVAIVDEIVDSGGSLLAALAYFKAAFPEAQEFFAVPFMLFIPDGVIQGGVMPWMYVPGATGTLELPDQLLTRRIDTDTHAQQNAKMYRNTTLKQLHDNALQLRKEMETIANEIHI